MVLVVRKDLGMKTTLTLLAVSVALCLCPAVTSADTITLGDPIFANNNTAQMFVLTRAYDVTRTATVTMEPFNKKNVTAADKAKELVVQLIDQYSSQPETLNHIIAFVDKDRPNVVHFDGEFLKVTETNGVIEKTTIEAPEPSTLALLGTGTLGLLGYISTRRKRTS